MGNIDSEPPVDSAVIADGSIVNADISASAAIAATKVSGTAVTLADSGTVTSAMLAGAIAPSKVTGTAAILGANTYTGLQTTAASGTATAGLNVPHGAAPDAPVNGDMWTTSTGLFVRINGVTKTVLFL